MISPKNASYLLLAANPGFKITGCFGYNGKFGNGYIFSIRPNNIPDDKQYFGGLFFVEKANGKISGFVPTMDLDGLAEATASHKIDLDA